MEVNLRPSPLSPSPATYTMETATDQRYSHVQEKKVSENLSFLKSVFWGFSPEKPLTLLSPEQDMTGFCHFDNQITSRIRHWCGRGRRAINGPLDHKARSWSPSGQDTHRHSTAPRKENAILHLQNESELLNHLTCSGWWITFLRINSIIILWAPNYMAFTIWEDWKG